MKNRAQKKKKKKAGHVHPEESKSRTRGVKFTRSIRDRGVENSNHSGNHLKESLIIKIIKVTVIKWVSPTSLFL